MKQLPVGLTLGIWLAAASQASAGMTVITLTDIARARIDALSFFLFIYLVIALVVPVLFVISFIVPGVLLQWEMLRQVVWIEVR